MCCLPAAWLPFFLLVPRSSLHSFLSPNCKLLFLKYHCGTLNPVRAGYLSLSGHWTVRGIMPWPKVWIVLAQCEGTAAGALRGKPRSGNSCWPELLALFASKVWGPASLCSSAIFLPIYFLAPSFCSKIRSYPGQLEFMVCLGAELYFNSNSNRVGSAFWLRCSSSGQRLFPQHPENCLFASGPARLSSCRKRVEKLPKICEKIFTILTYDRRLAGPHWRCPVSRRGWKRSKI